MKKLIIMFLININSLLGWEINTHRAIDRKAIEVSENLQSFIRNSGIPTNENHYKNEIFEGYGTAYLTYIMDTNMGEGEKIGVSKWKQTFGAKSSYQQMIEAGSILEDAQWPHLPNTLDGIDRADGRFVNHFYDAQNGGKGLVAYNILEFQNVLIDKRGELT